MHRQRAHSRVHDPLHKLQRIVLRRQQSYLGRHRDLRRHGVPERGQDGAQQIGVGEQRGAHARMRRERLRTPTVQINPGNVLHNRLGCLDSELGV